jgi:pimeloyl-ACP methyl ester carboxylesterase
MHSLTSISPQCQTYQWLHQGRSHNIAYDIQGQGTPVLLLPAFSTVSSRTELAGIAQILAPHVQVITLDWLGFGESDRPKIEYNRALYQTLLQVFVQGCCPQPLTLVAAGHAAGYAMQLAQDHPESCAKLFLIAPTWKGPLRAMGAPPPVASGIRNLVRSPLLGQALYSLNTHPEFLKWMYQRHVYVDQNKLTPESRRMAECGAIALIATQDAHPRTSPSQIHSRNGSLGCSTPDSESANPRNIRNL